MESSNNTPGAGTGLAASGEVRAFWPSTQQARIWSQGIQQGNAVAALQLDENTDEAALRTALKSLVERHEILRTVFRASAGMKVPFQVVLDCLPVSFEAGPGSVKDAIYLATQRRFDLENGPVLHARLVIPAADQDGAAVLVLALPALLSDGESLAAITDELGRHCSGIETELPAISYAQFSQWQSDLLESDDENAQAAKAFWNKQQFPALTWPSAGDFVPGVVRRQVSLGNLSEEHFLAAYQCLLSRVAGEESFEVAVWRSGRGHEELRKLPGLIGRFLPVPVRLAGDFQFTDVLAQVRGALTETAEWEEYFASQNEAAVLFEFRQQSDPARFRILSLETLAERFALKLVVTPGSFALHFDESRFTQETIERWASHFLVLLQAAISSPENKVATLPLLSAKDVEQIQVEWNRTEAAYPRQSCLHQLFESQVERNPDASALISDSGSLSYAELNSEANRLAGHLRGLGVGRGDLVGLALDHGRDAIVAVLAILKAGGAYVPVSADHPKARLAHQLSGASAIITDSRYRESMPDVACPLVLIDLPSWAQQSSANPDAGSSPDDLVYVIYTSGSTGVPKGVAVRHRNLVNYAWHIANTLPGDHLHFAAVSPLTSDLGNTCVYPSLISGGCLHLIPQAVASDSRHLADWNEKHPFDVLKIVPSHLNALLETDTGRGVLPRRHLITGGEALTQLLVERIQSLGSACQLWNHYGPTETTVGSLMTAVSALTVQGHSNPVISIGRPIANTQVYILDRQRNPVPIGVTGELYIGGDGVAAGYLNQPELTSERFIDGQYRTGDLARFRSDGAVEFLGRMDGQVKIRGYRVELGEIEAVVARYAGVRQAVVIARPDERGDAQLIGYVVANSPFDVDALRAWLKEQLPPYMIPAALVAIPKLPLTANGKIDRRNLPEPARVQPRVVTPPRTESEKAVAAMWCEIFHRDAIGIEENFFEIGGHSLIATQVVSRVRERFNVQIDMTVLFRQPTIEALAQAIDQADTEASDFAIEAVARSPYRSGKSL